MNKETEKWTVLKVLDWTKSYLGGKGIENSRLEAEWMLCRVVGLDRMGLYLNFDRPLTPTELADYRGMVLRRSRREPLQYILGDQEFRGLDFEVAPAVLIPRHDTEVLVEEALKRAKPDALILDIGTGSGCIAISLAKELPQAEVHAVDLSAEALEVARRNAERHGVQVQFHQGSLFEPVAGKRFDLAVSNPPYIPAADIEALQPEVRDFEPRSALDGGPDGLDFYRRIVEQAPGYLTVEGYVIVEVGIGQAHSVAELLPRYGFGGIFTTEDPGGIERVVGGRLMQ